jgi:hypothetical protein
MARPKKTAEPVPPQPEEDLEVEETEEQPEAPPEIDVDSLSESVTASQMERLMGKAAAVNKPDISRLPDALERGKPVFKAGDKIVIERYATVLTDRPYLDTRTYRVLELDEASGAMKLYDESLCQFARDNYRYGSAHGFVYKLAMGVVVATKKKRGRPRKAPVEAPTVAAPTEKKRGRGRPPGSKNRPKAEIREEKAAKRKAAAVKAAKKTAKKKPKTCKTV